MSSTARKIHLTGDHRRIELPNLSSGLKPGMLCERAATGVQKQSTAVSFSEKLFALEDALQGRTTADAYLTAAEVQSAQSDSNATADPVQLGIMAPGTLINAMLRAGTSYAKGNKLFPTGDGTLRTTTGSPTQCIAVCEETIDLSASGAVATLAQVRIV